MVTIGGLTGTSAGTAAQWAAIKSVSKTGVQIAVEVAANFTQIHYHAIGT